jgi:hypothetical protein
MPVPEVRFQGALDAQMVELQFDGRNPFREKTPNVARADVQPCYTVSAAL